MSTSTIPYDPERRHSEGFGGAEHQEAAHPSIAGYRPRCLSEADWDSELGSFVRQAINGIDPKGRASGERYARLLAELAAWGKVEGLATEVEVLLDPAVVERFVTLRLGHLASRATYRSDLRRIGRHLTKQAPWEPRAPTHPRRSVAVPYSGAELDLLWRDACAQPSVGRQRAAIAIYLLGLGAGLDGRWISEVRGTDVQRTRSGGSAVSVSSPRPRVVPVVHAFSDRLAAIAVATGSEPLVGTQSVSPNRLAKIHAGLVASDGAPKLSARRLRSTWLLRHLEWGTRIPELAVAAGLDGVAVLSDLLPYASPLSEIEAEQQLEGTR